MYLLFFFYMYHFQFNYVVKKERRGGRNMFSIELKSFYTVVF